MTSGGTVSGSRQRNSIGRRSLGSRSRIQIIVGTSRTIISTTVSTDRINEVMIEPRSIGSVISSAQAAPVRSPALR